MTSISLRTAPVRVLFFNNGREIYGNDGLLPATVYSVGIDLRACISASVVIPAGERRRFPVGIAIEPTTPGIAGFVYSRSGLGSVKGLVVAQGVGIIDPDYRGEIIVPLLNTSKDEYTVQPGERIAQIVFQRYWQPEFEVVEALGETQRGAGGFGHTGK